jgi:ABC-type nitrate/sulfonate/bicarbonate transport system permease component
MASVAERQDEVAAAAAPRARIPGQPGWFARYEGLAIGTASVALFLVIWQLVAAARVVPPLFLPGPSDILGAYVALVRGGTLANDLWISGQELFIGFGLAIAVGLPLGILMGWYTRLNYALDPFVSFLYSTPRIALVPLLIIWFGIGVASKVAIVFLGAFFPIVINTVAGMHNLDPGLIKAARSFGASDLQLFRTVALPGSVPFILTGLRLGVGHALIGVVVGELVAAQAGIGYMMATAGATFQTAKMFAGLLIVAGAGLVLTAIIARVERRFQAWKPSAR